MRIGFMNDNKKMEMIANKLIGVIKTMEYI